jgi:hypothetical protein
VPLTVTDIEMIQVWADVCRAEQHVLELLAASEPLDEKFKGEIYEHGDAAIQSIHAIREKLESIEKRR